MQEGLSGYKPSILPCCAPLPACSTETARYATTFLRWRLFPQVPLGLYRTNAPSLGRLVLFICLLSFYFPIPSLLFYTRQGGRRIAPHREQEHLPPPCCTMRLKTRAVNTTSFCPTCASGPSAKAAVQNCLCEERCRSSRHQTRQKMSSHSTSSHHDHRRALD